MSCPYVSGRMRYYMLNAPTDSPSLPNACPNPFSHSARAHVLPLLLLPSPISPPTSCPLLVSDVKHAYRPATAAMIVQTPRSTLSLVTAPDLDSNMASEQRKQKSVSLFSKLPSHATQRHCRIAVSVLVWTAACPLKTLSSRSLPPLRG